VDGGCGYTKPPKVKFKGGKHAFKGHFEHAKGKAIIQDGHVVGVEITDPGCGYKSAPKVIFDSPEKSVRGAQAIASINTEVKMISASPDNKVPLYYPMMDGRAGGVPDPENAGPSMIQIGNEGGFLPAPVVLPNTPIGYVYNRRDITVLNVQEKTLFLGPAERGDVIIDFSKVPKHVSTIILYNDAPAPVPGFDPRVDYYTNDPDQTSTGGAPSTLAGYGPNTRTVMQFRLSDKKGDHFNLEALQTALPQAYLASQPAPIVPETAYPGAYHADTNTYARIQDDSLTFTPVGATGAITVDMQPKAIAEEFELNYARMNAVLGSELPFTNAGNQTTVLLNYIDPPVEFVGDNQVQIWRVTHNGVDTHAIHTHLFNMQVINRVGWDGMIKPPDPNELGWKDTVRMNPLENAIVAIRPKRPPNVPFDVPNSIRPLDPSMPLDSFFNSFDPYTGTAVTWENTLHNFGWEYVWHCHLLGHEENDMMRPVVFCAVPLAPEVTIGTVSGLNVPVTITIPPPPPGTPALNHYEVTVTEPGPFTPPATGFLSGWVVNILPLAPMPYTITVNQTGTYVFRVNAVYGSSFPGSPGMISLPTIVQVNVP
jgi:FtsP/CotA-like multicopper oxidase with cupredoxin domain